ncbi:MAG: DoxX family protein [bacterium]|nr:DoxX family protein [bacterium]
MIKKLIQLFLDAVSSLKDFPPLLFRLVLAYGFYEPAMQKFNNFSSIIEWFGSLGIPFPTLNAYMAVATEVSGVILLTLGLATRFISIPLIVVMLVAIKTVHWQHGFAAGDNGFEIPFYYMLMLISLIITGAGKFSLDYFIKNKN